MTVVANDHGILAAGEFCCVQPTCNKRPSTWIGAALEDLHMHYNLITGLYMLTHWERTIFSAHQACPFPI
ncbi:hypothetical protein PBRA_003815 [Plasmodiophora brassicae]|uniref:Uncharacterized protein n=1 Tax=Plasmodiophora brassicae TaxID=37360 RepID=A0A0G4IID9_PLABS|nr:hypothetical protein PBRA_003815 [Plasmodiophora brassicae]